MKRFPQIVLIGIVAAITIAFWIGWTRYHFSHLRYIEKTTHVDIPRRTGRFHSDGYDFGVSAYTKIHPSKSTRFLESNNFVPCDHNPEESIFGAMLKSTDLIVGPFPPSDDLMMLFGSGGSCGWGFYFHPKTNRLWVTVIHPDMAGDSMFGEPE